MELCGGLPYCKVVPLNLAVLISGRGSNLKAIIDAVESGYLDKVSIICLIANKECEGLKYAEVAGIPVHVVHRMVDGEKIPSVQHDKKVMAILENYSPDLIAMAGYDQVLKKEFVQNYKNRIMNIHPSLLPAFSNTLHAYRLAYDYGVKITGITIHFAVEEADSGPIIIQAPIMIKDEDTLESLITRGLDVEHILYPIAIKWFSEGRLRIQGRKVIMDRHLDIKPISDFMRIARGCGINLQIAKKGLSKGDVYLLTRDIMSREANVIKQTLLALRGDFLIPKFSFMGNFIVDGIIVIDKKKIPRLADALQEQPLSDLKKLGDMIKFKFGQDQ